jgi:hypothetical protein
MPEMIDQKIVECHEVLPGSLLERYLQGEQRMEELHDGIVLRRLAERLTRRLGSEPVQLFSTSEQGAGLAAACAALRKAPTRWRKVDLLLGAHAASDHRLFLVEILDPGAAWRDAASRRFPQASFLFAQEPADVTLAA